MADPIGLIGAGGNTPINPSQAPAARRDLPTPGSPNTPTFKQLLMDNLRSVNQLQQDATQAIEDLQTGRRDDVETVLLATQKADLAFRTIQALRNKVMEAYDEVRQIRV